MSVNKLDDGNMKMSEDELMDVTGGAGIASGNISSNKKNIMRIACSKCGQPFYADVNKTQCKCPVCGKTNQFMG